MSSARDLQRAMDEQQEQEAIESEVQAEERESEAADLQAGYPPRRWRCDCGAEHGRGHFQSVGVHRCLACGYVGEGGTLLDPTAAPSGEQEPAEADDELRNVLGTVLTALESYAPGDGEPLHPAAVIDAGRKALAAAPLSSGLEGEA